MVSGSIRLGVSLSGNVAEDGIDLPIQLSTETVGVEIQAVESIAHQESKTKTEDRGESMAWAEFGKLVGLDISLCKERNKASGDKLTEAAKEKGFSGWEYKSANRTFVKVDCEVNTNVEN